MKNPSAEADQFQRRARDRLPRHRRCAIGGLCFGLFPPAGAAARGIPDALGGQPHQAAAGGAGARADLRPQGPAARRQRAGVPAGSRARPGRATSKRRWPSSTSWSASTPEELQAFESQPQGDAQLPPGGAEAAPERGGARAPGGEPPPLPRRRRRALPDAALSLRRPVRARGRLRRPRSTPNDLEELGDSKYAALTHIGKSGLERKYEDRAARRDRLRERRDQRRGPRAARGQQRAVAAGRRPAAEHRRRPAARRGQCLRRPRRRGGRGGSAHRRSAGDGQPAAVRPEPVRQRHLAQGLQRG